MAGIAFKAFAGVIPRVSDRLIDNRNAATADNLKAFSGELRAWRQPLLIERATKYPATVKSIYRVRDGTTDYWLNWLTDVDVVPGPLAGDTSQRLYYTGDNSPKKTNFTLATTGTDYPADHYEMGLPVPTTPTVAVGAAGAGATSSRTYVMTVGNSWDEQGPPSAVSAAVSFGATGFTVNLTSLYVAAKACAITRVGSTATVVCVGHGARDQSKVLMAGAVETEYNGTFVATVIDADTFTYQVTGAPATPATGSPVRTLNYNQTKRYIYRSLVGSNGLTAYQLVTTISDMTTASYADTVVDTSLGAVCPTFDPNVSGSSWLEPPEGMQGLIALKNDGVAGFYDNVLCLCEPGYPHAWPLRYQLTFPSQIVGIKAYGSTIVVATEGVPWTVTGSHPENMGAAKVEDWVEPCTSKRGMADGPGGVYYPSPNGLIRGGLDGFSNASEQYFTGGESGEWKAQIYPDTLIGAIYDGRYFGFFSTEEGAGRGFILPKAGDAPGVLFHTQYVTGAWADPATSKLYIVQDGNINLWDGDENNLIPFDWWSKVLVLPEPANFGAWIIDAAFNELDISEAEAAADAADLAYNILIFASGTTEGEIDGAAWDVYEWNGSSLRGGVTSIETRYLTFEAYAEEAGEMALQLSVNVESKAMDRMPSDVESDVWQFRMTGNIGVKSLKVGEVPKDLKAL